VTLQFGLSIFLIIGTLVIYQQIQHVKNRTVGYDKENLMMIWTTAEIETNFESVRQQLMATGVVKSVAHSNSPITDIFSSNTVEWAGMDPGKRVNFSTIASDYDYTATMGIKLLAGRDFSRDFKSDSSAVLINQAAAAIPVRPTNPRAIQHLHNNYFTLIIARPFALQTHFHLTTTHFGLAVPVLIGFNQCVVEFIHVRARVFRRCLFLPPGHLRQYRPLQFLFRCHLLSP
jgi:hypothetical protein